MINPSVLFLHDLFLKCRSASIDTRTLEAGDMFFALTGPNFDGHKFVSKAIELGAKFIVIDNEEYCQNEKTVLVQNVEKSLQDLAMFHRLKFDIPVIGLTGSNGKTTTKELMHAVLSQKYCVQSTKGNLNNHLGVPITLLGINTSHEIAIIEMGANHIGEIAFLARLASPTIGIITNIGKAHLEGFGSLEGVRKGKTELYKYLELVNGIVFYNKNDENLEKSLPNEITCIDYSIERNEIIQSFPKLVMIIEGDRVESKLTGSYNALNILVASTLGEYFKIDKDKIIQAIESYYPQNNRSQIKPTTDNLLILDAYNANPSSMRLSIANLGDSNFDNKVLILGHMLELGKESKEEHEELLQFIKKWNWNQVFLIGDEFDIQTRDSNIYFFTDVKAMISNFFSENKISNSTILLKGSRGAALETIVEYL